MNNKLLEVSHLKKNYHDIEGEINAISDISFTVYDKEFLSIVGPSGCGKSTILSILSNLEEKSEGSIIYHKDNLILGYMLQKDYLFPWCNILDNCLIGLKVMNKCNDHNINYVLNLLNTYGLKDFIYKYPSSLSGGMRQRVGCII